VTNSDGNGKIVVHCRDLGSLMSRNQEAADAVAAKGHNRFDNIDDEPFFALYFLTRSGRPGCSMPTKIEAAFSMSKEAGRMLLYVSERCT
jgi:hypothetical protein